MKVICFLFDPNVGGPHVRARSVYKLMKQDGHEVRIAIPAGEGSAEAYHRAVGLSVDRPSIRKPVSPRRAFAMARYLMALPLGVARVSRYLRSEGPDVVHVNGAFDLVPAFAAKVARVPLVWHLNDTAMPKFVSRVLGCLVRSLATRVVVAADSVAAHYGMHPDEVRTLYAPVDIERFSGRAARSPGRPVMVGMVANWNPLKGQDRFIEVVHALSLRGWDLNAVLVGQFSEVQRAYWEPLHQRIDELGLSERFAIVGYSDQIPEMLAAWDVSLLTSRSEACPMSVLEAMAVGVPQVCFQVGGVDELLGIGETRPVGISVPEGDIGAVVTAVERILKDVDFSDEMRLAGPERARGRFSLETCVNGHLEAYQAAIHGKEHVS